VTRPRDVQRQRVYDSEHEAFSIRDEDVDWHTIEEVRLFVASVITSREWTRFGGSRGLAAVLEVRPGRSNQHRGRAHPEKGFISLPPWTWRDWYVLHELAHMLAPLDVAWHGREFCNFYLALLERFGSPGQARLLRAVFAGRGVRFS
jgi:putative metallohydrolase (TIGR04338 family)